MRDYPHPNMVEMYGTEVTLLEITVGSYGIPRGRIAVTVMIIITHTIARWEEIFSCTYMCS